MSKNICIDKALKKINHLVYLASIIEDKTINYHDVIQVIESYDKAIKTIPFEKVAVINGIKRAYEYIINRANSNEASNVNDILKINALIDEYEEYANAGNWRNSNVIITGVKHKPPLINAIEAEKLIKHRSNITSFEDGVKLCVLISKLQLFNNGNKRTAICYANLVLLFYGFDFIKISDREEYMDKLLDYYEDDNKLDELIELITKWSI